MIQNTDSKASNSYPGRPLSTGEQSPYHKTEEQPITSLARPALNPMKEAGPIEIAVRNIEDELAAIDEALGCIEVSFKPVLAEPMPRGHLDEKDGVIEAALEVKLLKFLSTLREIKAYLNELNDRCRL